MVLDTLWAIISSVDIQKQKVLIKKINKKTQQKKTKSISWLFLKNRVTPLSLEGVLARWSSTFVACLSLEEDNSIAKSRKGQSR